MEFDKEELIAFIDGLEYHINNNHIEAIHQDLNRLRARIDELEDARRKKKPQKN